MRLKPILLTSLLLLSCGRAPHAVTTNGESAAGVDNTSGSNQAGNAPSSTSTESVPLSLLSTKGTMMRLMEARGLTQIYSRIFKKNTTGYVYCNGGNSRVWDPDDCFESIFDSTERAALGTFDMHVAGRGPINVPPAANLTLNYMRSLRSGLQRECAPLIVSELANLKVGNVSSNVLIKSDVPTPADLNAFFRTLMGATGTNFALPLKADDYVASFNQTLALTTDKDLATKNAYTALCVAIAMDPHVFIY